MIGRTLGSAESVDASAAIQVQNASESHVISIKSENKKKHKPMQSEIISTDKIPKIENSEVQPKIYKIKISFLTEKSGKFYWMNKDFTFSEFENKKLEQPACYNLNKITDDGKIGATICDGKIIDIKYKGVLNETNVKIDESEIPGKGDPVSYLLVVSFPK